MESEGNMLLYLTEVLQNEILLLSLMDKDGMKREPFFLRAELL